MYFNFLILKLEKKITFFVLNYVKTHEFFKNIFICIIFFKLLVLSRAITFNIFKYIGFNL